MTDSSACIPGPSAPFDFATFALSPEPDCPTPSQAELSQLAHALIVQAAEKNVMLATAESCTGGLVSGALTSVAGSSAVVLGGVVSYAIPIKQKVLGVPSHIVDTVGVVSSECACAMARGIAELMGATVSLSTTGIAGPGGAEPGKPVGTVWFGLHTNAGEKSVCKCFSGDRESVRTKAVACACGLLLGAVKNFSIKN